MPNKNARPVDDRLGHSLEVPAEEFTAIPGTGEFPEWRADHEGEDRDEESLPEGKN